MRYKAFHCFNHDIVNMLLTRKKKRTKRKNGLLSLVIVVWILNMTLHVFMRYQKIRVKCIYYVLFTHKSNFMYVLLCNIIICNIPHRWCTSQTNNFMSTCFNTNVHYKLKNNYIYFFAFHLLCYACTITNKNVYEKISKDNVQTGIFGLFGSHLGMLLKRVISSFLLESRKWFKLRLLIFHDNFSTIL